MADKISNPCIRCGKERIVVKTWEEDQGNSHSTHTSFVCPDKDCQEIVDQQLAEKREKRKIVEENKQKRQMFRSRNIHPTK
ncbi:MAG: hypothetical protein Q7S03_02330 [bacterium]|nr:hypothetical protein [bacterium]